MKTAVILRFSCFMCILERFKLLFFWFEFGESLFYSLVDITFLYMQNICNNLAVISMNKIFPLLQFDILLL